MKRDNYLILFVVLLLLVSQSHNLFDTIMLNNLQIIIRHLYIDESEGDWKNARSQQKSSQQGIPTHKLLVGFQENRHSQSSIAPKH